MSWWSTWRRRLRRPVPVPDGLWRDTLAALPFLDPLSGAERDRLRTLCALFLAEK